MKDDFTINFLLRKEKSSLPLTKALRKRVILRNIWIIYVFYCLYPVYRAAKGGKGGEIPCCLFFFYLQAEENTIHKKEVCRSKPHNDWDLYKTSVLYKWLFWDCCSLCCCQEVAQCSPCSFFWIIFKKKLRTLCLHPALGCRIQSNIAEKRRMLSKSTRRFVLP